MIGAASIKAFTVSDKLKRRKRCETCGYMEADTKTVEDYNNIHRSSGRLPLLIPLKEVIVLYCHRYPEAKEKKATDWCGEWRNTEEVLSES